MCHFLWEILQAEDSRASAEEDAEAAIKALRRGIEGDGPEPPPWPAAPGKAPTNGRQMTVGANGVQRAPVRWCLIPTHGPRSRR
jgi:hypothetical protein